MVNGSPTASSRRYRPRSRRSCWKGSRAASENNTHTSVTSTNGLKASGPDELWTRSNAAITMPTAMNTIGAVRSARSSRVDNSPQANRADIATTMRVTSMVDSPSLAEAAQAIPLFGSVWALQSLLVLRRTYDGEDFAVGRGQHGQGPVVAQAPQRFELGGVGGPQLHRLHGYQVTLAGPAGTGSG